MTAPDPAAVRALAPRGRLRAAINTGNPALARPGTDGGEPTGVSVDVARRLGAFLGLEVDIVAYGSARGVAEAVADDAWDLAFMAQDPDRAGHIAFSAPYVEIEASYVVRSASPFHRCADLDRPGLRIAAASKAAYEFHLTRSLRSATIERAPDQGAALRLFLDDGLDAGAGVRQALDGFAAGRPDLRVLPDRFMAIGQCMAIPRDRGETAKALVDAHLRDLKTSGALRELLDRDGHRSLPIPAWD